MIEVFPSIAPWKMRLGFYGGLIFFFVAVALYFTAMPGRSAETSEAADPQIAHALREDVRALVALGPRNFEHPKAYAAAGVHLEDRLAAASRRPVHAEIVAGRDGTASNYFVQWGDPNTAPLVVIGAHYDSASNTPGGNDNGTGVAVLLYLAEQFFETPPETRALRLVLFANEEPPYFWQEDMGSLVHARASKERGENIVAMLSLETMGHYSQALESQEYPFPFGLFYPSRGNFVAFVGNVKSRSLVAKSVSVFRAAVRFPSEGGALPGGLPGVGWSDHWSFWQVGYPALMVTDTAPFRDVHYHQPSDLGDQIDFGKLAVVARGLEIVAREITSEEED